MRVVFPARIDKYHRYLVRQGREHNDISNKAGRYSRRVSSSVNTMPNRKSRRNPYLEKIKIPILSSHHLMIDDVELCVTGAVRYFS